MKGVFKIGFVAIVIITTIFLNSCHNLVVGKGDIVEQISEVDFSKVELNSDFTVYLTEDTFYQIKVQGYENLVPHVFISADAGTDVLSLGVQQDYVFDDNNIVIYLTAPNYASIKLNSNGNIIANDSITTNSIEVINNGSGTISLFGDANVITAYAAGSGITRLCAMQADTVSAFMLGSGILSTKPMNKLNAQITGSGQIQYMGSPSLTFTNTGGGSLLQTLGCY